MINISNLHKSFGENTVLNGVNINLEKPGITAVLGPNGSGKTTLIKSVLGMVIPDEGQIKVNGQSIKGKWKYRHQIDYLPQIARFPENLQVQELFSMIKDLRTSPANDEALISFFELTPFLNKRLGNLSGGTRQKVNLVQAFMYDSPILMLDEPTSGLDPVAMIRLRELILKEKAKGKIIQLTTHIMSFVEEMADELIFLLDGKVYFQGPVAELKAQYQETNLERAIAAILLKKDKVVNQTIMEKKDFKKKTEEAKEGVQR